MNTVLVHDDGAVRTLVLNRPDRRNAIDLQLRADLLEAVRAAMDADPVRAIVLTGAGEAFCSGGDIGSMVDVRNEEAARARTLVAQDVVRALRTGPKPVVAAIEGAAIGAGLALALACDHLVAGDGARFSAGFTRIGLAGDMGITHTLAARVGAGRARQMLMLPEEFGVREALRLGIVDKVVPAASAAASAVVDAARLAAGPPLALLAIKKRFNAAPISLEDALELEAETQARLFMTRDLTEGVAAFHEKRSPVFKGR